MTHAEDTARQRADMPLGTRDILNTRSLQTSHRRLAKVLRPGVTVLDVGCGTGAITRGIAQAVQPQGQVVGIDVNSRLIQEARQTHSDLPNVAFEVGDISEVAWRERFDVVTASRVLQWLATPLEALRQMVTAAKPGGVVIVLDYNHEKIAWHPHPPPSLQRFYQSFLRWRAEAGMDNTIADHLVPMLARVGLTDSTATPQHELAARGEPDFQTRLSLWAEVAATRGQQMVADGLLSEAERAAAESEYRAWMQDTAESQTLYLLAVEGVKPRA